MISKAEWEEWYKSEVTKEVLMLLKVGEEQAIEDVVRARGEIADLPRGAALAYAEMAHVIRTGEGLYIEEQDA